MWKKEWWRTHEVGVEEKEVLEVDMVVAMEKGVLVKLEVVDDA